MSVVIYQKEMGVYLGSCMGMGFWSKLDAVDQSHACTFHDAEEARRFMESWETRPADVEFVEVVPDEGTYASIAACVRAGLPAWLAPESATVNAPSMPI